jgi:hypothetical protein
MRSCKRRWCNRRRSPPCSTCAGDGRAEHVQPVLHGPSAPQRPLRAGVQRAAAIYPEVDFSEVCFTRHLLTRLYKVSPERFEIIREEVSQAWRARMRGFLAGHRQAYDAAVVLGPSADRCSLGRPARPAQRRSAVHHPQHDRRTAPHRPLCGPRPAQSAGAVTGHHRHDLRRRETVAAAAMLGVAAHKEAALTLSESIAPASEWGEGMKKGGARPPFVASLARPHSLPVSSGTALKRSATSP